MKYAVQLADVAVRAYDTTVIDPVLVLLRPVLTDVVVKVKSDEMLDNTGMLLDDSDPERLEAILCLLRMNVDHRDLRVYQSKTGKGSWKLRRARNDAKDAKDAKARKWR